MSETEFLALVLSAILAATAQLKADNDLAEAKAKLEKAA
jgi:hypothetical protein